MFKYALIFNQRKWWNQFFMCLFFFYWKKLPLAVHNWYIAFQIDTKTLTCQNELDFIYFWHSVKFTFAIWRRVYRIEREKKKRFRNWKLSFRPVTKHQLIICFWRASQITAKSIARQKSNKFRGSNHSQINKVQ